MFLFVLTFTGLYSLSNDVCSNLCYDRSPTRAKDRDRQIELLRTRAENARAQSEELLTQLTELRSGNSSVRYHPLGARVFQSTYDWTQQFSQLAPIEG